MKWEKEDIKLLEEFLESDKSVDFISAHFKTSPENVRMVMSRNNLKVRKNDSGRPSKFETKHKKIDLATRIRILRGEEIRKDVPTAFFTDEQIKKWLTNDAMGCNLFSKEVLNVEIQDYQLDIISKMLEHKRFVAVLGRQSGKDWLCSVFAIWMAICKPNSKMLIVSASQRSSDLLYNRILNFIGQSNELFDSVEKSNMEFCRFKNGSEIWSLPATGQIRGQTEVTHIICNEVAEIPDETFPAIEPMLLIKGGHLYLFSTPRGCTGKLWEAFNNPIYGKIQLPSTANKYIDKEEFETAKQTMPHIEFDMEYNANFQQNVDCFFNLTTIQNCSYDYDLKSYPETGKTYYCGIDWGRIHDSSVITIISEQDGILKIEDIIELIGKPFPEQEALVLKLNQQYNFRKIVVEYAGLSIGICDNLVNKLGSHKIELFRPTLDNKEEGYNLLKKKMENKEIIIPKSHIKLQSELRLLQYQMASNGKTKIFHLSRSSDDFADSLMFACWSKKAHNPLLTNMSIKAEKQLSSKEKYQRTYKDLWEQYKGRTEKMTGRFRIGI